MRKKQSTWQKLFIKFGLWLLRKAGNSPVKYETKEKVYARRTSYFPELEDAGYTVEKKTEYHFRINDVLDIYPTNARWHNLVSGKRGSFRGKNLARFVREHLGEI